MRSIRVPSIVGVGVAVGVAVALASSRGDASIVNTPCVNGINVDDVASGDRYYFRKMRWCYDGRNTQDLFFRLFKMDDAGESDGWSGGWGGGDLCDYDQPAGRTINSIEFIYQNLYAEWVAFSSRMNELDAVCANDNPNSLAYTNNCWPSSWTHLPMNFFYGAGSDPDYPIWGRAATLVHEARHYDDACLARWDYTGHVTCGGGDFSGQAVCDPEFWQPRFATTDGGEAEGARPISYGVQTLIDYANLGPNEPRAYRQNAWYRAQYQLFNRFLYVPANWLNLDPLPADTVSTNPCSNGQILQYVRDISMSSPDMGPDQTGDFRWQCANCPPGRMPDPTNVYCAICPPGQESLYGTQCVPCGPGSYQDPTGALLCPRCPQGTWSSASGIIGPESCQQCPAGSWSSSVGLTDPSQCTPCPAGTWSTALGAIDNTVCMACPPGRVSMLGSGKQTDCIACIEGSIPGPGLDGMGTQVTCRPCPAGKYAKSGDATCSSCAAGTFSPGNLGSCIECIDGQVSAPGSPACWPCLGGQISNLARTTCEGCPVNHISMNNQCVGCGANRIPNVNADGCVSCQFACAVGPFCGTMQVPDAAGTRCVLDCPVNYAPDVTNTGCVKIIN